MKRSTGHRPLISACLITKDESAYIEQCLRSVADLVDEIVIYDTGSRDDTVALASAAGAMVIDGHWDDDFGRARNEALARCRGDWILHIDADEELVSDTKAFRRGLKDLPKRIDALRVEIQNLDAAGRTASIHKNIRLFRRTRCEWRGRLHERVVKHDGESPAVLDADGAHFLHHGYAQAVITDRDKLERNLRISEQELDEAENLSRFELGLLKLNLARSLVALDRVDETLDTCEEIIEEAEAMLARSTIRLAIETCVKFRRPDDARVWLARASEQDNARTDLIEIYTGTIDLMDELPAPQLAKYLHHGDIYDDDGLGMRGAALDLLASMAMASVGRYDEAADAMMALAQSGEPFDAWESLADAAYRAGRDLEPIAGLIPDRQLRTVLARLVLLEQETADALGTAIRDVVGDDMRLVAFGAFHAQRLSVEHAMPWATYVRRMAGNERCPLLAIARSQEHPPMHRFTAALCAYSAFECDEAFVLLNEAAEHIHDDDMALAQVLLEELTPELSASPM